MPYKNINWVKLEKRLLNDYRYYSMSQPARLLYIEMMMIAAQTNNKIPANPETLKSITRSPYEPEEIAKLIEEIRKSFPKLKKESNFYKFSEWSSRTNQRSEGYPRDIPGISQGYPKDIPGISPGYPDASVEPGTHSKILNHFVELKGWDKKVLRPADYARFYKSINKLLDKAGGDVALVFSALDWVNSLKWSMWSLEYVNRNWAEFIKHRDKPVPAASREVDLSQLKR